MIISPSRIKALIHTLHYNNVYDDPVVGQVELKSRRTQVEHLSCLLAHVHSRSPIWRTGKHTWRGRAAATSGGHRINRAARRARVRLFERVSSIQHVLFGGGGGNDGRQHTHTRCQV